MWTDKEEIMLIIAIGIVKLWGYWCQMAGPKGGQCFDIAQAGAKRSYSTMKSHPDPKDTQPQQINGDGKVNMSNGSGVLIQVLHKPLKWICPFNHNIILSVLASKAR